MKTEIPQEFTEEVIEKVKKKFPKAKTDIAELNPPPESAPYLHIESEEFADLLKKTINGSAAGRSGLKGDHLKPILDRPEVTDALLRVLTLLIDGQLPKSAHPYIGTQVLLALGEKARPVCIGEYLTRAAGKLVEMTIDEHKSKNFFLQRRNKVRVLQVANNVPGGAEAAIHLIERSVHEKDSKKVVIRKTPKTPTTP